MNPFHIFVSTLNVLCGLTAVLVSLRPDLSSPGLESFAFVGGYFANFLAVICALVIGVFLLAPARRRRSVFAHHWLGIFNGCFVVLVWFVAFGLAKLAS